MKISGETIFEIAWWRKPLISSHYMPNIFAFPLARLSTLASKCSVMFKCHKLKKRKHLPALKCKMRETLNWQSQIIPFFLIFPSDHHHNLLRQQYKLSEAVYCPLQYITHIPSALECNCMLRTTCLLGDPLPNVTLILNDNADVTLPVCEVHKGQLNINRS